MMADPDMQPDGDMPFDGKRMFWGGFEPIARHRQGERSAMANPHGSFIWYELMTPDPAAAKRFYDAVVGWNIDDRCRSRRASTIA